MAFETQLSKCAELADDQAFGEGTNGQNVWPTEGIDQQLDAWGQENAALFSSVAQSIRTNLTAFNNNIDQSELTAEQQAEIKFTEDEITYWSNPANWSYGGESGYGIFEDSSEFNKLVRQKTDSASVGSDSYVTSAIGTLENPFGSDFDPANNALYQLSELRSCQAQAILNNAKYYDTRNTLVGYLAGGALLGLYLQLTDPNQTEARLSLADYFNGTETISEIEEVTPFANQSVEYKEQCFLLSNIFNLAAIKKTFDLDNTDVLVKEYLNQSNIQNIGQDQQISDTEELGGNFSTVFPNIVTGVFNLGSSLKKKLPDIDADPDVYYNNYGTSISIDSDPFGFVNLLTQSPNKKYFYDMDTPQISSLQPMIKLYKVVADPENECSEIEVEIKFDSHAPDNTEDILRDLSARNPGVGLKSFNFSYDGNNPFAIKKSISANLSIFSNSFHELFEDRLDTKSGEIYRYIDLVLKTGELENIRYNNQQNKVILNNLDKLNFRLKVVLGWRKPIVGDEIFSENLLESLGDQAVTLNLTPTIHDFKVDDSGRVTLDIQYLAYVEDYFDNLAFNIFSNPEVNVRQILRNLRYRKLNKECLTNELNSLKTSTIEEERIREERGLALKSLLRKIIDSGRVFSIPLIKEDIPYFGFGSPYGITGDRYNLNYLTQNISNNAATRESTAELQRAAEQAGQSVSADPEAEEPEEEEVSTDLDTKINFIFAGDLIDTILGWMVAGISSTRGILERVRDGNYTQQPNSGIEIRRDDYDSEDLSAEINKLDRFQENIKRFRLVLGPLEVTEPRTYNSKNINLCDVPVSVKHFLEWMTTNVADRNIETFTLPNFLNSFFQTYVVDYLNNDVCFGGKAKQKMSLFQLSLTDYSDEPDQQDKLTRLCNTENPFGVANPPEYLSRCENISGISSDMRGQTKCTTRLFLPENPTNNIPVLQTMGVEGDSRPSQGICQEYNYMIFYAGRSIPAEELKGIKSNDESKGLWHYQIGRDKGIIKNISLSKTNSTGLAEVRFEQDGYDGLRQLRVVYDVTIKTYLDVSIFPGTYIYVDPKGFDPAFVEFDGVNLTQLGIGGYCMVWKSEHSISADGSPETTIHAKWVSGIFKDQNPDEPHEQRVSNNSKCSA